MLTINHADYQSCFAGWLESETAEEIILYNYSSDPDGPDCDWNMGQVNPTNIYRHVLRFTRRP